MGQSNINPTTIWTPQTGWLNQPGTLTAGYQFQPQVTSVYDVPGLLLPYQTCLDATGGSSGSEACVNQNLATQQENFRRTAEYNAGTLKLPTVTSPPIVPSPPPTPVQPVTQTVKATPPQTGGTTAASTNAGGGSSSSSSGGGTAIVTTPAAVNPALYWIAGLAAVVLIIAAVK
jgi:hypothetical protein